MEQLSKLNLNTITSSLSEGINGLIGKQSRNDLEKEIFGSISDSDNDNESSSSPPITIMKKPTVRKDPPVKKELPKIIDIPDVKEALNEYFKLKQKYDNQIIVNKKKLLIICH